MSYAKIKDSTVIMYPYTWDDLTSENPNTNFDDRYDIIGWYNQTEDSLNNSYTLVEVGYGEYPTVDNRTQIVTLSETPSIEGDKWVLGYTITNKNQQEITQFDDTMETIPLQTRPKL